MIENLTPKFIKKPIKIIGCGLAGAEVAFILANNGFDVHIFDNGLGLAREKFSYYDPYETYMIENMRFELECLNSPLLSISKKYDYDKFAYEYDEEFMKTIRFELEKHPKIKIFNVNIDELTETETTVIATGHNTSKKLIEDLEKKFIGNFHVKYFQPESLVLDALSFDNDKLYFASECECYVNLTEEEYKNIYEVVMQCENDYELPKELENEKQITVENYARRGFGGLRNSILRPHFAEGRERPYASIKLTYNKKEKAFVLDEFFSAFDDEDQQKVIKTVKVFENCKVLRYSKVKRKTYLLAPSCLNDNLQIKRHEKIYLCGGFGGTVGGFESLLTANLCAYSIICDKKQKMGVNLLKENTCLGIILDNLIKKSVVNFRLFNLKYDIINKEDLDMQYFDRQVEIQKFLSKSQIEKFKEKFYGKYF